MNKQINSIIIAMGVQSFQSSLVFLAMAWYFTNITQSPLIYGSLMAFRYAPGILFTMLSGIAVDRMKKIPLGISASICNIISHCFLLIAGLLNLSTEGMGYWIYAVIVILMGISSAILTPLERTLIPSLAQPEKLKSINSIISIVTQSIAIIGTSLAGVFLLIGGFSLAMAVAIFMAIISLACYIFLFLTVKLTESPSNSRGVINAFKSTIKILNHQRWIFSAIASSIFTNMAFVMIMDVLLPNLFSGLKFNGSAALGICFTVMGIGTLLGAAMTYKVKRINFNIAMVLYVFSTIFGAIGGLMTNSIIISIVLFGLFSLFAAPVSIIYQTELQQIIPNQHLGSTMGFIASGVTMAQPLGVILAGFLLLKLSGEIILIMACGISLISVLIGWWHIYIQKGRIMNQHVKRETSM
ncbi:MFS transporter [Bacillus wiedmannii]